MIRQSCLLLLFSLFVSFAGANCPVHGCKPSCSYCSDAQFVTAGKQPRLLWSWKSADEARPSGAGCVTNAARIVCPLTGDSKSFLISWDTSDNGQTPWNVSFVGGVVLPLMNIEGDVIVSDGTLLAEYQGDGTPFGKAVHLFPVNGQLFDLTLVNLEVILLYKCGFLVTYFTNGVPSAGVWLNDTLDGEPGTFIPLGNPASVGKRLYLLGAFRAYSESESRSSRNDLKLRMFAIDLGDSAVYRIAIAWYRDFTIPGISLPYLSSRETLCTEEPPEKLKSTVNRKPPAHISVEILHDFVAVLFNYGERYSEGKYLNRSANISRMMIFEDLGKSSNLKFTGDFTYPFQALAYNGSDMFWTAIFDVNAKQSVLQQYSFVSGKMVSSINVSKLLAMEDKQLNITSELTFLYTSSSSQPLVFCAQVESTLSLLVAVDTSDGKLLWTVDLGSEQCLGQISSVDGAKETFLIVTTLSQMLVYDLT